MEIRDIEDIIDSEGSDDEEKRIQEKKKKAIRKNFKKRAKQNKTIDTLEYNTQIVPGTQKIFVKTFGCSHNMSDSEFMMGQLVDYGYTLVEDVAESDLVLINSCTVKNPSQAALMR
jgi:threonylcarbamoyladenosine tRNA methylthiotransferase CDKAL1